MNVTEKATAKAQTQFWQPPPREFPRQWLDITMVPEDVDIVALFVHVEWGESEDQLYRFALVGPALRLAKAGMEDAALMPLVWQYLRDHPEYLVAEDFDGNKLKDDKHTDWLAEEADQIKVWALMKDKPTTADEDDEDDETEADEGDEG